ncbi:type II toxin-antitoxin system PemK/MazF family toxin [Buchananella hordeovulneris]|uniref:type II toxin-antitoxin system PemK/MazF family toxin n=1 Tax=Buchananella hordeovulneris TaxID=52770 RepID=UPI0026DAC8F3|nr:type II toxin-antitoxin system PemK/MazF family toxin [Buchananella hordeovulneris]MDO5080400.1 type II toxin-antitoxin system PemK/MazF family toxin [Buchananella hordeovulneris]
MSFWQRAVRILRDAALEVLRNQTKSQSRGSAGRSPARSKTGRSARPTKSAARPTAAKPTSRPAPAQDRGSRTYPTPPRGQTRPESQADVIVLTELPDFSYTPHHDGAADPGEVVWTWIPYEDDASQGKDRPVLVLGWAGKRLAVAQMTSKDHGRGGGHRAGRVYVDVGTGAWDPRGRESEVRIDRLLAVKPQAVRREGATLAKSRFARVVAAIQAHHE